MAIHRFKNKNTGEIVRIKAESPEKAQEGFQAYLATQLPKESVLHEPSRLEMAGNAIIAPLASAARLGGYARKIVSEGHPVLPSISEAPQVVGDILSTLPLGPAIVKAGAAPVAKAIGKISVGSALGQLALGPEARQAGLNLSAKGHPILGSIIESAPALVGGAGAVGLMGGKPLTSQIKAKALTPGTEAAGLLEAGAGETGVFPGYKPRGLDLTSKRVLTGELKMAEKPFGEAVGAAKEAIGAKVKNKPQIGLDIQASLNSTLKKEGVPVSKGTFNAKQSSSPEAVKKIVDISKNSKGVKSFETAQNLMAQLDDAITKEIAKVAPSGKKMASNTARVLIEAKKGAENAIMKSVPQKLQDSLAEANSAFSQNRSFREIVGQSFDGKKRFSPDKFSVAWREADKSRFTGRQIEAIDSLLQEPNQGVFGALGQKAWGLAMLGVQKAIGGTVGYGNVFGQMLEKPPAKQIRFWKQPTPVGRRLEGAFMASQGLTQAPSLREMLLGSENQDAERR